MDQALTLVQLIGYSMPLIRIVRVWTGASPLIVTRLFVVLMMLVLVILKAGASSPLTRVRMAVRWPAMKVLASPNADRGVIPFARKARYFASITGSIFDASIGPLAISFNPRR